jgi:hypothetical protein
MLVSFDIDGTLELGDPPGPLTIGLVRSARAQGIIIGSASDRTLREQQAIWALAGIEPDFTSRKHELAKIRAAYACERFLHMGDTAVDAHCAQLAGFAFVSVHDLAKAADLGRFDLAWFDAIAQQTEPPG